MCFCFLSVWLQMCEPSEMDPPGVAGPGGNPEVAAGAVAPKVRRGGGGGGGGGRKGGGGGGHGGRRGGGPTQDDEDEDEEEAEEEEEEEEEEEAEAQDESSLAVGAGANKSKPGRNTAQRSTAQHRVLLRYRKPFSPSMRMFHLLPVDTNTHAHIRVQRVASLRAL